MVDLDVSLVNVGVIVGFFVVNFILRSAWEASGYFALDLALFAVLHAGFFLVRDLREHSEAVESLDWAKLVIAMLAYVMLVILFQFLEKRQITQMDTAFNDFKNRLSAHYVAQDPRPEADMHGTLTAVDFVKRFAEQSTWVNVFFRQPRPDKLERTELIRERLQALAPEGVGVPEQRSLYLTPSRWSLLAAGLVLVTVLSASVEKAA
jgi:hypothetical protein